ncbi:MAG: hypothetical protein HYY22_02060 [Thaumarchaeota archaeon]|nr:hypothetical protein [Nitrososphaerota archaeon]
MSFIVVLYVWAWRPKVFLRGAIILEILISPLYIVEILSRWPATFDWVIAVRNAILEDGGVSGSVSLIHAAVGAYVFKLGVQSLDNSSQNVEEKKELVTNVRSILGLTAFFSLIVALGVLAMGSPYRISWTLRPAILVAGFILGSFGLSLGTVLGYGKNAVFLLVGALLVSGLAFILGIAIIPFTGANNESASTLFTVFTAQLAFFSNSILLTGVIGFIASYPSSPLNRIIRQLFT